jgi:hypothetical protein
MESRNRKKRFLLPLKKEYFVCYYSLTDDYYLCQL